MASPFAGINMMSYAMRNFQLSLETAGHNVANVNTRGYSRQRVEFGANDPLTFYQQGWKQLGQGMHVTQIGRLRDAYLEKSQNLSNGNLGKFGTAVSNLSSIEKVYGEPSDSGIISALGKFFDSWSALGSSPGDPASKFEVRNAGQVLTDRIRGAWKTFDQQQSDLTNRIDATITQINDLAAKVDSLNKAIKGAVTSGQQPGDLLDQRDLAVSELSSLVNVQTETFQDGTLAVYAGGFTVVDSSGTMPFPATYDAVAGTVTNGTVTNPVRSGELSGLFIGAAELSNQKSRLDNLANTLRTQVNTVHMTGVNSSGATNIQFFNDVVVPPQTGAIDFDLDPQVKADVNNVMSGVSGNAGDGGLAHALSDMRDSSIVALGTKTFGGFMSESVANLASSVSYYKQAQSTEQAVSDQISNQVQAVSGVSLDDEMADMVKFQRSYQAAAKTLTVFDQMTQDVLAMLNR